MPLSSAERQFHQFFKQQSYLLLNKRFNNHSSPFPKAALNTSSLAGLADFAPVAKPVVAAEEGGTALIGCDVPESHPKAQVRFQIRGKWLEKSTGEKFSVPGQ